uniref:Uncharacterized protein n=1 Tax=Ligilactobacillus acidipiscis TaxID=89059 RepID=A0A2R8FGD3_9LACO|nr:hypothetical protein PLAC02_P62 [Ligilactobacillus acidipiscis]
MEELKLKKLISWTSFVILLVLLGATLYYFYNIYFNIIYVILALALEYLTNVDKPLNNYIYHHINHS